MDLAFECAADDGTILAGTRSPARGDRPAPCVVALHAAAAGTRDHWLYRHLHDTLVPAGIGVALFDRRGSGASGGAAEASLARLTDDALAVLDHVAARPEVDPHRVGVWGVSQGGWLAPMAAAASPAVALVVAVSAPGVSPSVQMHFAMENVLREAGFADEDIAAAHRVRAEIEDRYLAGDLAGARSARIAAEAEPWAPHAYLPELEDLTEEPFGIDLDPRDVWQRVRVPTLAIYGEWDRWVPIEPSIEVWATSFADRIELLTVERVPNVGHMMTVPNDPHDPDELGPISLQYTDALRRWVVGIVT
jgi:pimeloyl-ACP methyl ester carboxylesterase